MGISSLWLGSLSHLVARGYFGHLSVAGRGALPAGGPALFVGLHRNGAVDGWVYRAALRRPLVFMLSAQLRRHPVGRLMFDGIEVVRGKDAGDRRRNVQAISECLDVLEDGGNLFVFPEGTSTLADDHLPFQTGAAKIAARYLRRHPALTVIPLSVRYAAPWTMGSAVDVLIGTPLVLTANRVGRGRDGVAAAHSLIAEALDSLFREHRNEKTPGGDVRPETGIAGRLCGLLGSPIVAAALLLNAPPLIAGYWAGRTRADDTNVVSLWRILVGLPLFLVWWPLLTAVLAWWGGATIALAYTLLTAVAARLYGPVKRSIGLASAPPPARRSPS